MIFEYNILTQRRELCQFTNLDQTCKGIYFELLPLTIFSGNEIYQNTVTVQQRYGKRSVKD